MPVSQTSLQAYWNPIIPRTQMQEKVYGAIKALNKMNNNPTNLEIAQFLNTKEHKITGRIVELVKKGDIFNCGIKMLDGYNRKIWRCV